MSIVTLPSVLLLLFCISLGVAWLYALLSAALVWENARFWKARARCEPRSLASQVRSTVIVPCKGHSPGLAMNLESLIDQDHPNYDLILVAESPLDPAVPVLREAIRRARARRIRARLVIAGRATVRGQKVHNLLAALEQLDEATEILVFADADIRVGPNWLRWMVEQIGAERVGARTGFRWFVPQSSNLATRIGCLINNSAASLMGRGTHFLVWGGSWAIHRRVFRLAGVAEAWSTVLSDDLAASRALQLAGLGIQFEPRCVGREAVAFDWRSLFEFVRRQLLIGRCYSFAYWCPALAITLAAQAGYWGGWTMGVAWLCWGKAHGWLWLLSSCGLHIASFCRQRLCRRLGRSIGAGATASERRMTDWLGPIAGAVLLFSLVASAFGRSITWAGVHYCIDRNGRMMIWGRSVPERIWVDAAAAKKSLAGNRPANARPTGDVLQCASANQRQPIEGEHGARRAA